MARKTSGAPPRKAPESVTSQLVARILCVAPAEELSQVLANYLDTSENDLMRAVVGEVFGLYTWTTDVARDIMCPGTTPLTEHLMSMPGTLLVVKDSSRSSAESIWLAVADPTASLLESIRKQPHRGLTHTFQVGQSDEVSNVIAIQLNSCQP